MTGQFGPAMLQWGGAVVMGRLGAVMLQRVGPAAALVCVVDVVTTRARFQRLFLAEGTKIISRFLGRVSAWC